MLEAPQCSHVLLFKRALCSHAWAQTQKWSDVLFFKAQTQNWSDVLFFQLAAAGIGALCAQHAWAQTRRLVFHARSCRNWSTLCSHALGSRAMATMQGFQAVTAANARNVSDNRQPHVWEMRRIIGLLSYHPAFRGMSGKTTPSPHPPYQHTTPLTLRFLVVVVVV